jgi:predicted permease
MGWMSRMRTLWNRDNHSSDLDEELEFHLTMREKWNAEHGMGQEEARANARQRFGNATRWKEMMGYVDVFTFPETVWQDVRFAVRMLLKHASFTAIAILALGLGIGVNTAIFTVYRAFLLRGIDAKDNGQMVNISAIDYAGKGSPAFSYPDYEAYRDLNHVFSGLVAATGDEVALTGIGGAANVGGSMGGALARAAGFRMPSLMAGGAEYVTASLISDNYFSVLGVGGARGRVFTPEKPGGDKDAPIALISWNYWQRRFESDPEVVGKTIKMNGAAFTIIGITPRDFMGTNINVPDFWLPLREQAVLHAGSTVLEDRENTCCRLYGRLQRGTRLSEAQAEMNILAEQLRVLHSPHSEDIKPKTIQIYPGSPFGREIDTDLNFAVALIMCAVGMVLLIACANLASLQLARSAARQKEMGVRLSLGAKRGRLVRQLLTESALLGLISGGVSLLMTWCVLHLLVVEISATLPAEWGAFALHVTPDMQIFCFVFAISLLAGVIFGLVPALESSKPNLTSALKEEGGLPVLAAGKGRFREVLIGIQVTVRLVLLIAGGILIRSSMRVLEMKTGYETKHVLGLDLNFPDGFGYSPEKQTRETRELRERILTLPGVGNVTIGRPPNGGGFRSATVALKGNRPGTPNAERTLIYTYVQPDYFETLDIPISSGSGFRPGQQLEPVAILSQSAAQDLWPGKNPIGESLVLDGSNQFHGSGELIPLGTSYRVIGTVHDTRGVLLDGSDSSKIYLMLPSDRLEDRPLLIRTERDPRLLVNQISGLARDLDSNLVVYSETLDDMLTQSPQFVISRCSAMFASMLGALGLMLASVGIYGTVSYAVVRRAREVGIRMALGARKRDVIAMILRETTRPVLVGLAIGLIGATAATHLMRAILFGVSAFDPVSFAGVSILFFLIAMLAAYVPARRAARVDPMVALRYE